MNVAPSMNHTVFWPVDVFRHRMSGFASPLKSPTPPTFQFWSASGGRSAHPMNVAPSINHTVFWPADVFRHKIPFRTPVTGANVATSVWFAVVFVNM